MACGTRSGALESQRAALGARERPGVAFVDARLPPRKRGRLLAGEQHPNRPSRRDEPRPEREPLGRRKGRARDSRFERGTRDRELFASLRQATSLPIIASGGVTIIDDLRHLQTLGINGAVIGMALYTGALDPLTVAQEFSS